MNSYKSRLEGVTNRQSKRKKRIGSSDILRKFKQKNGDRTQVCWVILYQHTFFLLGMYTTPLRLMARRAPFLSPVPTRLYRNTAALMGKRWSAAKTLQRAYRRSRMAHRGRMASRWGAAAAGVIGGYTAPRGKQLSKFAKPMRRRIKPATVNSRAREVIDSASHSLGFLYVNPVRFPQKGTLTDQRRFDTIFTKGIKICHQWNLPRAGDKTIECHFALIQIKSPPPLTGVIGTEAQKWGADTIKQYIANDFFRRQEANTTSIATDPYPRTRPFNDYEPGTSTPWDFGKNCLPMSQERKTVLFHKTFTLFQRYAGGLSEGGKHWYKKMDMYIPVNKKMEFLTEVDTFGKYPLVFLFWCNPKTRDDMPIPLPAVPQEIVQEEFRHKVFIGTGS